MLIRTFLFFICLVRYVSFVIAGNLPKLTSNVTTVTEGEIYKLKCTSQHYTVSFFKNGRNFTSTWRKNPAEPCNTSIKDATCNISRKSGSGPYVHELNVKATNQQGSKTTWQCTVHSSGSPKSNTVSVVVNTEKATSSEAKGSNFFLYGVIGASFLLCVFVITIVVLLTIRHRGRLDKESKKAEQNVKVRENILYDCKPVDESLFCPPALEVLQDTSGFEDQVCTAVDKGGIKGVSTFYENSMPDVINQEGQSVMYDEVQ